MMRLVRLYSDQPKRFTAIAFKEGLSAILAEIRIPENRELDTHNLGKTTIGALIDFCLLKGKDPTFFLFKHEDVFQSFVFFLEIELSKRSFVTIRRGVVPGSRIGFFRSEASVENAALVPDDAWDHHDVSFDRARALLDGMLGFQALRPWGFRKLAGYLIRTQQDYQDVFQLGKFSGKHQDWKPFVAHLLGAHTDSIRELYDKRDARDRATADLQTLTRDWGPDQTDPSLLDGLIAGTRRSVAATEEGLNAFNFRAEDQRTIAEVVDQLDDRIVTLNDELYRLHQLFKRIDDSLERRTIAFDPGAAIKLFAEAGVVLEDQLKKEFQQLIEFNRAITEERRAALVKQRAEAEQAIASNEQELEEHNRRRAESLAFLRETDTLDKYKQLSRELSKLQAELAVLEQRREAASTLMELRRKRRALSQEFAELQNVVEDELAQLSQDEQSRFGQIRRYFADIVAAVIGEQAVLSMAMNNAGGVDFRAELMGASGVATSGDKGTSYRRLLCIAFDLAVLRA